MRLKNIIFSVAFISFVSNVSSVFSSNMFDIGELSSNKRVSVFQPSSKSRPISLKYKLNESVDLYAAPGYGNFQTSELGVEYKISEKVKLNVNSTYDKVYGRGYGVNLEMITCPCGECRIL